MKILLSFYLSTLILLQVITFTRSNLLQSQEKLPYFIDLSKNIGNVQPVRLSSIGKKISYISLETKPGCLLQEIQRIEICNSFIFVSDLNKLLQFDLTGRFIRQIGSVGRGPGEYQSVGDFCTDNVNQIVYIISSGNLLKFGFDGQLLESVKLSFRPCQLMVIDHKGLFFHLWNLPGRITENEYSWIITDLAGTPIFKMKKYLKRVNEPGLIVGCTPFYAFNKCPHFMEFGIDTLYSFEENQKKTHAIFRFGELKLDPDPLLSPDVFDKVSSKLKDKLSINLIWENSDYLFLQLNKGLSPNKLSAIYDKNDNITKFLNEGGFQNDLDGGLSFWPKAILNDGTMVDYIDSYSLLKSLREIQSENKKGVKTKISNQLLTLSKKLTETSNPVLILVK
jgi:hypothetical protein